MSTEKADGITVTIPSKTLQLFINDAMEAAIMHYRFRLRDGCHEDEAAGETLSGYFCERWISNNLHELLLTQNKKTND